MLATSLQTDINVVLLKYLKKRKEYNFLTRHTSDKKGRKKN